MYRSPVPILIPIDDPADPRLEAYRDIRERDLVGRQGRFIAEGETVLRVLAGQDRHRPLSVLIAPKRLEKLAPILDTLAADVPVYLASQPVLDGIVGFELHRGILALAERAQQVALAQQMVREARTANANDAGFPQNITRQASWITVPSRCSARKPSASRAGSGHCPTNQPQMVSAAKP